MKRMGKKKESRRKLSPAEEARRKRFEETKSLMTEKGYETKDLTVGIGYANVMAFVLGLPVILVFTALFLLRNTNGFAAFVEMESLALVARVLVLMLVFCVLIVLHELIHGATWAVFVKKGWKAISFGVIVENMTPYCTCTEPLKKGQYIIGALMPTLLLGVLPAAAAVVTGSPDLFFIGTSMILAGGGDLTIILQLLRFKSQGREVVYLDHPYLAGLVAFVK